ncbi:MAG: hypothetical protein ABJL99_08625 [Aliishimia sp.]
MSRTPSVSITLHGQISVKSNDGTDLTPRGKKALAILAMLAEADTLKRARRWLEHHLWSDRASEQARGSLRQTLFELRKALGILDSCVKSDRMSIWLDSTMVQVEPPPTGARREFLEGLEVSDPQFSAWVYRKRLHYRTTGSTPPSDVPQIGPHAIKIQCGIPLTKSGAETVGNRIVDNQIGNLISDFIANSRCSVMQTDADLIVRTSIETQPGGSAILVEVIDTKNDEVVHSDHCFAESLSALMGAQTNLGGFCWNIADRALEKLAARRRSSDIIALRSGFSQDAVRAVLSFDEAEMMQSLNILAQATDHLNDGLFHALRAWALSSIVMEDRLPETNDLQTEIREALDLAQRLNPEDAMVAGIVANVSVILFEDFERAQPIARAALRDQPNNIFAVQALSLCRLRAGNIETAYQLSKHNQGLARLTKYSAMCDLHHALLCLRIKRTSEAIESSRTAADATPGYRAPNRQLLGLYAAAGLKSDLTRQISQLGAIEPDFTVDRFLFDRSYPTNTLRAAGYLETANPLLSDLNTATFDRPTKRP